MLGLRSNKWLTKPSRPDREHHGGIRRRYVGESVQRTDHLQYLDKTFDLLKQYKVKLNLEKYTFGVAFGKFVGYLVTQRGIEADPDQISAILNMKSPTCVKELKC